jgi:hypothetical protein
MTKLTKKLKRESYATYRGRAIIVELRPPDLIVFRLKKTHREYPLTIAGAFNRAVQIEAFAEMNKKKADRKARRMAKKGI